MGQGMGAPGTVLARDVGTLDVDAQDAGGDERIGLAGGGDGPERGQQLRLRGGADGDRPTAATPDRQMARTMSQPRGRRSALGVFGSWPS